MDEIKKRIDKTISVVIPLFNEEHSIGGVIEEIRSTIGIYIDEIIIVNDASTDSSAAIIKKDPNVTLINQPYNKGYGASLKAGARQARSEYILMMDADGQHDPQDAIKMFEQLDVYDMVVGVRARRKGQALLRTWGKWVLQIIASYLVGRKIPDINSGFRIVRKECINEYKHILPNGFSFSTTITLAMIKGGYNVSFMPITIRKRLHGRSSVANGRDGAITLLLIARCISLFNPLKIYAPVALLLLLISSAYASWGIIFHLNFPKGGIVGFLTGIVILFFGILADQISAIRRGGE